jgi:hypothetical protein
MNEWSDDDYFYLMSSWILPYCFLIKSWTMIVGLIQRCICTPTTASNNYDDSTSKKRCSFRNIQRKIELAMLLDFFWLFMQVTWSESLSLYHNLMLSAIEVTETAGKEITDQNAKVLSQEWNMEWEKNYLNLQNILDDMIIMVAQMKNVYVFFSFMTFIEMMRHFSGNKHLAIVPRSLAVSASSIGYLLIVLFFITFIFAIILSVWYGDQFNQFSTLWSTMVHLILMNMGEWSDNYWDIYNYCDDSTTFFLLFLSYCLLVVIVIMNMVLAVVLDSYAAVKEFQDIEEKKDNEMKIRLSQNEYEIYKNKKSKESMTEFVKRVNEGRSDGSSSGSSDGSDGDSSTHIASSIAQHPAINL